VADVAGEPGVGAHPVLQGGRGVPVIIGIVLFGATAIVLANIVVDILYVVLDPRVRLH
jgi:peptide/nickel transport system permease protein